MIELSTKNRSKITKKYFFWILLQRYFQFSSDVSLNWSKTKKLMKCCFKFTFFEHLMYLPYYLVCVSTEIFDFWDNLPLPRWKASKFKEKTNNVKSKIYIKIICRYKSFYNNVKHFVLWFLFFYLLEKMDMLFLS